MRTLILITVLGLILVQTRSDFLGYNELHLIEERKPFKIKCISDSIPHYFSVVEVKWYNVTVRSTDRYDPKHEHILLDNSNEFVSIRSNGELHSSSASPEMNGYYSCRVHYSDRRHHKKMDHKLIDHRLHLIEVTKRPLISKLEELIVVQVFTDTDSVESGTIDQLLKQLIFNQNFETRIHTDSERVVCKFNSELNLMKCQLQLRSNSKNKCLKTDCSSDQSIFEENLGNDLQKIETLLKTNEEVFKTKLKTRLIDFEVNRIGNTDKQLNCSEGYYPYSGQCRPCPSGTYRAKGESSCHDCPINTFNPYFGQSSCINCPESSQTAGPGFERLGEGSVNIHECKFFYSLGFYGFIKDFFKNLFQ